MNKKITIVVQICGGLGNQLFQYLFAISNFPNSQYQIIFDCSDLMGSDVKRPFVLDQIGLSGNFMYCTKSLRGKGLEQKIVLKDVKWIGDPPKNFKFGYNEFHLIEEELGKFQKILSPKFNTYFRGYWQSYKYWENSSKLLQSVWGLITKSDKYQQAMRHKESLQINSNCCAIHIRGGDYLEFLDFHGVCRPNYYSRAMTLCNKSSFHIFTDDNKFALSVIGRDHKIIIASDLIGDDLLEFICLTEYSNFIIPNSSFSYLAACFASAKQQDVAVIGPYPWYSIEMQSPAFPSGWMALNRATGNTEEEDLQKIQQASVSVVLPVHGRAQHLESVINSIMSQTHLPVEIIISQNNAKENVKCEVSRLAQTNRLIKIIDTNYPDSLSFARNVAINKSSGDYIAFIDDDDYWMPEKLGLQISKAVEMGAGLVASNFHEFNEVDGIFSKSSYKSWRGESWINALNQGNPFAGGSAALVRRDVFDSVGLFDEGMPSCEDHDMWWRIAISGETLFFLEDDLVGIRKNSQNISNNEEFMIRGHLIHLSKMLGENRVTRDQVRKYYFSVRESLDRRLREDVLAVKVVEGNTVVTDIARSYSSRPSYYFIKVIESQLFHMPLLRFIKKALIQLKEDFRAEIWGPFHSYDIRISGMNKIYFMFYLILRVSIAFIMAPWELLLYLGKKLKKLFSAINI